MTHRYQGQERGLAYSVGLGSDEINTIVDDDLSGDAVGRFVGLLDVSIVVDCDDDFIVPLADVELLAVETELRSSVLGARQLEVGIEAFARN